MEIFKIDLIQNRNFNISLFKICKFKEKPNLPTYEYFLINFKNDLLISISHDK